MKKSLQITLKDNSKINIDATIKNTQETSIKVHELFEEGISSLLLTIEHEELNTLLDLTKSRPFTLLYFYEGNIKKSTEHGEGKKMFANGNYLNGTFDMGDFINGEQYNAQTQEKIIGKFKNGQPDGVVKVMVNGKTTTATFINGKKK